jgi:ATP-dependent RNA helicase DeaD
MLNKRFEQKKVPTGVEICEKQLFNLVDRVENVEVDEAQIEQFLPVIIKKLDWLSREDLIKHFVSVEFNRILSYYKNTPDLNVAHPEEDRDRKRTPKGQFMTLQINAGFQDGLNPPRLIGLINEQTRNRNIAVGRIEIGQKSSFFEVEKKSWEEVLKAFKDAKFEGVKVRVEISGTEPKARSKYRSNDRQNYKSDDKPNEKSKAWSNDLSNEWSKDKTKGRTKDWSKDKPKGKSNDRSFDRSKEAYGGKNRKRSPYKNW